MFNVGDPPGFLLHIHSCWFISLIDELPFTSVQSIFQFDDHDFDDVLYAHRDAMNLYCSVLSKYRTL